MPKSHVRFLTAAVTLQNDMSCTSLCSNIPFWVLTYLHISQSIFQDITVFNMHLNYLLAKKIMVFYLSPFLYSRAWAVVSGSNFLISMSLLCQQKSWSSIQMHAACAACMGKEHMRIQTSNEGGTVEPSNLNLKVFSFCSDTQKSHTVRNTTCQATMFSL